MDESFDHLLKVSNAVASFPCYESARRFMYYILLRGYQCEITPYEGKWQGYYKVTYWKEESNESQD